jgi:DNA-binding response OmpR family regulator
MNTAPAPSILLVEDDLRLAELVSRYLENNAFRVRVIHRGDQVLDAVQSENPDLLILDLGLPGKDGLSICRQLRPGYGNPVLILTARNSDIDHVLGLELGADDYVIKPVEPRVLMARINALLRRNKVPAAAGPKTLRFGALHINSAARSVILSGRPIALSGSEFELLFYLATHAGEILSREKLYKALYKRDYDGMDRMLDVRISHIRKKLDEQEPSERIKTVWGQGYVFLADAW